MAEEIVILDGARTAIGTFGGSLAAIPPIALAAAAAREALARSGVEGGRIGAVVFGHVINTEPRDMYLSRAAAIEAGVPDTTPAMNVNRLCGSGAQAIVSCVQALSLGDADFALAGGAESMSRSPYALTAARWGQKMGDTGAVDMMLHPVDSLWGQVATHENPGCVDRDVGGHHRPPFRLDHRVVGGDDRADAAATSIDGNLFQ